MFFQRLFNEQVLVSPYSAAVEFEGRSLNFLELSAKADQLAETLRSRGVGPGVLVGLFLERSLDFPIALIAVLKTGAVAVPIDTSLPEERIAVLIREGHMHLVLTHFTFSKSFLPPELEKLFLDFESYTSKSSAHPLPQNFDQNSPAYIIYTSGSSGIPKGIVISQGLFEICKGRG